MALGRSGKLTSAHPQVVSGMAWMPWPLICQGNVLKDLQIPSVISSETVFLGC